MQNKPNFRKSQMNVTIFSTKDYENISDWTLGQNKPNSNPIKPNYQKAKMSVNLYFIEDYRKKDDFVVRKNKPNLVRRRRIANSVVIEDYENEPLSGSKKQTQTKPISSKAKMNLKSHHHPDNTCCIQKTQRIK